MWRPKWETRQRRDSDLEKLVFQHLIKIVFESNPVDFTRMAVKQSACSKRANLALLVSTRRRCVGITIRASEKCAESKNVLTAPTCGCDMVEWVRTFDWCLSGPFAGTYHCQIFCTVCHAFDFADCAPAVNRVL